MCGIIGQTRGKEDAVREAMQSFSYRGPDAQGSWTDASVALGHLRLSIIDPEERSNQPFFDEHKELGIVFNGEIYNYRELRDELKRVHGVSLRTDSDTEVLLYGYKIWGEALLPRLRGMFAFAIYDARSHNLFLARDHAGIKPLYYAFAGGNLFFASECKGVVALLRTSGVPVSASEEAVGLYLAFGYVPSPLTLCAQVKKVPRSSWLRFDITAGTAIEGVWAPATASVTGVEDFEAAVRASVVEHTIADVPVGVFFSGGIDSSVIALVLRDAGINLSTYSVRVEGRSSDESYFKEIAERLGIKAHVINFDLPEFEEMFEHVLSRMDDPIADPSIFPTALVSRHAAQDVKVVLSGEGGDELFCGYPRALAIARMHAQPERLGVLDVLTLHTPAVRGKRATLASLALRAHAPVFYYLTQASLAFGATPSSAWHRAHELLARGDVSWLDRDWYLENMLLRKTDMATMYASLEGRVPLLGAQLWAHAPAFYEQNAQGDGKLLLRAMLKKVLPPELIERPKSGFGIPLPHLRDRSTRFKHAEAEALKVLGVLPHTAAACRAARHNAWLSYGLIALHCSLKNIGLLV